ncbi:MAG: LysR substrate-binding domain-containing protein [Planctomycetota bacterium]
MSRNVLRLNPCSIRKVARLCAERSWRRRHARHAFHAGLRLGHGPWRGLHAVRLIDSPLIVVAAPARAARLAAAGGGIAALAREPLLGGGDQWQRWLALGGARLLAPPVADFNDAGLMLQATEQDLGLALVLELNAADALQDGRLVRVSTQTLEDRDLSTYWLVHPPELADWPPLVALRGWLRDEMAQSRRALARSLRRNGEPTVKRRRR